LLIQAPLLVLALIMPHPASRVASVLTVAIGGGSLIFGLLVVKPGRRVGWWLVAACQMVTLAGAVMVSPFYQLVVPGVPAGPFSVALVAGSLLLAGGLALLGRRPRSIAGIADVLDAGMIAAGVVLLAWMFRDGAPLTESRLTESIGLPLAAVLLFWSGTKLVLAAGVRVPAVALLVTSSAALLMAIALLPAAQIPELPGGRAIRALWTAHGGLLGAAALHPSFAHATRGIAWGGTDLSPSRLVVFAFAAALVPTALVLGLLDKPVTFDRTLVGVAVPAAAATSVLLCLVGRLALTAHVSQRRAKDLACRSAALTDALDRQDALRQELAYRAMHDPLTGLSNRVVLAERVEWALRRPRGDAGTVLLLLDLDEFKDVNDTYGHPAGDELLASVAGRLLPIVPVDAVVARFGGDEFGIVFESPSVSQARFQAEEVLASIRQPSVIDGNDVVLSASVGMLMTDPGTHRDASEALRDADLALYAAKNAGKNRVVAFEPKLGAERLERTRTSVGLRRALARGELTLEYQPIVDLATGSVFAVEALVRWRPPGGEAIPPAQFIPIAESTGLIDAVGARVLQQACRDARRWYTEYGVAVSVNVSGHQLNDSEFANLVTQILAETGLPATSLILELSEGALITTLPSSLEATQLRRLREHGVRVAIDDFGTGYSSLAYVSQLPVDIVKLERSFADGGESRRPDSRAGWAFTGALVEAMSSVGLDVVAEGVETADQAAALRSLRCRYGQGYYFHRPMPATSVDEILSAAEPGNSRLSATNRS
jgi:diguanylate cyclase (GGDEF)-like protein